MAGNEACQQLTRPQGKLLKDKIMQAMPLTNHQEQHILQGSLQRAILGVSNAISETKPVQQHNITIMKPTAAAANSSSGADAM